MDSPPGYSVAEERYTQPDEPLKKRALNVRITYEGKQGAMRSKQMQKKFKELLDDMERDMGRNPPPLSVKERDAEWRDDMFRGSVLRRLHDLKVQVQKLMWGCIILHIGFLMLGFCWGVAAVKMGYFDVQSSGELAGSGNVREELQRTAWTKACIKDEELFCITHAERVVVVCQVWDSKMLCQDATEEDGVLEKRRAMSRFVQFDDTETDELIV
ncbi:hypothetical protein EJ06DRAFT_558247 [Trichodelitschia bisporula]|uniref:Uncharacterized protein n=1 Tax=Trichodelitschia bisporula TaxID=703511 RepID=A0A6G1HQT1_9PEZI|nr:hypothetical protein EJ06DRAFT_558247 [Trichodelitschia bisporula]